MPYRVAVAASGRGSNLAALLRALESAPIARVVGVFSNRPDAGALSLARAHDIPTVVFSDPADADAWLLALGAHEVDLVVLAGYPAKSTPRIPRSSLGA